MAKRDAEEEETPSDMNPMLVMARLTNALEALASRQNDTPQAGELMIKLTDALARVSEAQIQGAQIVAQESKRAHRPSNEVVHNRSVFNRRGLTLNGDEPGPHKVPLKCLMMIPWLAEWESLTREEVDLLNLLQPGEYMLKRNDGSRVRLAVTMDYKVDGFTPSRLILTHETAFNNDNFKLAVPLPDMLRQILRQHDKEIAAKAAAVLTDDEEEALIEAGELSVSQ